MKIGIIGAGHIGGTLAMLWTRKGHQVVISSRHPDRLDNLVQQLGPNGCSGTVEESAQSGEVVVLSTPLGAYPGILPLIKNRVIDKVVIDTMNPFPERDGEIAQDILSRGIASGTATQQLLAEARIVRAFSSIRSNDLRALAYKEPPLIAVPLASDNTGARETVMQLIRDAGFEPYDLGLLDRSKPLDPGGVLFGQALTAVQITELLME